MTEKTDSVDKQRSPEQIKNVLTGRLSNLNHNLQLGVFIPYGRTDMHRAFADRDLASFEDAVQKLQGAVRSYKDIITEQSYEALVELLGACKALIEMVPAARNVRRGFLIPSQDEYRLDGVRALRSHLYEKTKTFQIELLDSKESPSNEPASDITAVVTATDKAVQKV